MKLGAGQSTFVFTDIEGSTQLLEDLDRSYGLALRLQRQIIKGRFEENHGEQIGTEGDGLFWRFPAPVDALRGALAAQERFAALETDDGVGLRVRMGIHCGPVRVSGGEYIGLTIHEAARVCTAAHGDQILCSAAVRTAASDMDGVLFRDLGSFLLRGMPAPHTLYQVTRPEDGRRFPPPRDAMRAEGSKLTIWRRQATPPRSPAAWPDPDRFRTPEGVLLGHDVTVEILPTAVAHTGAFRLVVRRDGVVQEEYDGLTLGGSTDAAAVLAAYSHLVRLAPD